jgi:excisionase family DNA binding protein
MPSHAERLRARGLLTIDELAARLGVHKTTIKNWHRAGLLVSHKANDKNTRLFVPPAPGDPQLVARQGSPIRNRVPTQPAPGGAV